MGQESDELSEESRTWRKETDQANLEEKIGIRVGCREGICSFYCCGVMSLMSFMTLFGHLSLS
jgi:hypothetical protein